MGGPMGVYEANKFPYLYNEISYIKERILKNSPTLGICLGAQMIAKALGEEVYMGDNGKEVGWCNITVNNRGKNNPVQYFDKTHTSVLQFHQDTFDLPKEATLLASSNQYTNQIFSIGNNILGIQFHPEMMESNVEYALNYAEKYLEDASFTIDELIQETKEKSSTLKENTTKFLNSWLEEVLP
jgi:GMP synthase (glutamine-hydrolysing)